MVRAPGNNSALLKGYVIVTRIIHGFVDRIPAAEGSDATAAERCSTAGSPLIINKLTISSTYFILENLPGRG